MKTNYEKSIVSIALYSKGGFPLYTREEEIRHFVYRSEEEARVSFRQLNNMETDALYAEARYIPGLRVKKSAVGFILIAYGTEHELKGFNLRRVHDGNR